MTIRHKARLAVEVLAAYGRVRWSLRREDLPRTVAALRAGQREGSAVVPAAQRDRENLEAAVVRTLRLLPNGSRCLTRSLVLLRLLAQRGTHGTLVIAVSPGDEAGLDAHAWVEVEGRPLIAAAPDYGRLVTL
jgi:hypothetical protein